MEIQLQELIDQIKKDGVEAAEAEAASIIEAARAEAEKIVADAKAEADRLIAGAQSENERLVRSSEDAIRQAGRNLLISFRESITRELNAILYENVRAVYSSEDFAQLLLSVIEGFSSRPEADSISVILNGESLKQLEDTVLAELRKKMLSGVTLKASDSFDGGFRISTNNGNAYYDYSSEAVVEMLSNYLSPKVTELLKEA